LQQTRQELKGLANTLEAKVDERSRALEQVQAKLMRSEKLASLGELVAGIAHEINNPLTGILMYAAMVENDPRLAEHLKGDMQTITRETQRCAGIVQNLLNFSREVPPQKRHESINRLLDASLALVRNQPSYHDIRIEKHYQEGMPNVEVDPNQIEQVFVNLLINAGQAMPDGGVLTLTTALSADGERIDIIIKDTGCGIPPENLRRLFDPFFTTKGQRGTGLGLSVSYGIMQNHGGLIDVESAEGQGTSFFLHLPLTRKCQLRPASSAERRAPFFHSSLAASDGSSPPRRPRPEIPSFFSNAWKLGRSMPTSSAARVIFQSLRRSASRTKARSTGCTACSRISFFTSLSSSGYGERSWWFPCAEPRPPAGSAPAPPARSAHPRLAPLPVQ
jgi:nitrogen-specific signal transduction histidine kinase